MRHDFPFSRFEGLIGRLYRPLLRRRLARLGDGATVSPYATLEALGSISIGPRSHISRRSLLSVVADPAGTIQSQLEIGENSYIGRGCVLSVCGRLSIGSHVTFGDNVYCSAGQHAFGDPGTRVLEQPMVAGTVEIGDGAWIGYGVFISSTATLSIGTGAIVAANSVVTKDVAALTMVGGTPARVLKRFDPASKQWTKV